MTEYIPTTDCYRALVFDAENGEEALCKMVECLCRDLSAGVLVTDIEGNVISFCTKSRFNPFGKTKNEKLDTVLTGRLGSLSEDLVQVPMEQLPIRTAAKKQLSGYTAYVYLLGAFGIKTGSMVVYVKGSLSNEGEKLCIFASGIVSLITGQLENKKRLEKKRKQDAVKSVTETLSYSELMACTCIFRELGGKEGLIVASRIADKEGITRSVIVNAIRKLEGAGIIESRSLGMKGTYIKVLNAFFEDEIKKINKSVEKLSEN